MSNPPIPAPDVEFLRAAARYLESPSYLMKLAEAIGQPVQKLAEKVVPTRVADLGKAALRRAMFLAADTVVSSPAGDEFEKAYNTSGWTGFWHRLAVTATGGVGGAFGLPGLALELPVTTGILFRSIAAIADDFGEDLRKPEIRLDCLSVFCYGGPGPNDEAMDATFITTRLAMNTLVREAAEFMASRSSQAVAEALARGAAPVLLRFIDRVAAQFNVAVSQKFLAQSIPVVGIATGAAINNAFAGHFNTVARYYFGIRKLERQHGQELVQAEYRRQLEQLRGERKGMKPPVAGLLPAPGTPGQPG